MPELPKVHNPRGTKHLSDLERAKRNQRKRCYATNDPTWRKMRAHVLAREPICRLCRKQGKLTPANTVDHWDGNTFNNHPDNLVALCVECHSRKTVQQDGGFGKRKGGAKVG